MGPHGEALELQRTSSGSLRVTGALEVAGDVTFDEGGSLRNLTESVSRLQEQVAVLERKLSNVMTIVESMVPSPTTPPAPSLPPPPPPHPTAISFSRTVSSHGGYDLDVSALNGERLLTVTTLRCQTGMCRLNGLFYWLDSSGTELGTSPMAEYCDTGGSAPVDNPGYTRVLPEETATLRLFAYGTSRIACGDVTFAGSVAGS